MDDTSLRRIKAEQGKVGQWTVTDAHADRSGKRMIYSSITPYVYMMNTSDDGVPHTELDFTNRDRYEGFGVSDIAVWIRPRRVGSSSVWSPVPSLLPYILVL
jgi:WD repeat-containing protein 23